MLAFPSVILLLMMNHSSARVRPMKNGEYLNQMVLLWKT
jgi:hypothetical protein